MTFKVDPSTRVENATPYLPQEIKTWSSYVNGLFETRLLFEMPFEANEEISTGDALQLQQLMFMARMMATCQHLQAENEQLRARSGEVLDADKDG